MEEFRADMERWLERNLAPCGRVSVAALSALDTPAQWAASFLAEDIPLDFQCALQDCKVRAVPDLQVASMVPQPFDNPLRDALNLPVPLMTKIATSVVSTLSILSGYRL